MFTLIAKLTEDPGWEIAMFTSSMKMKKKLAK